MNTIPNLISIIGLSLTGLIMIAGFMKLLRNNRRLKILGILTLGIALFGIGIKDQAVQIGKGNDVYLLFGPLLYIATYGLLRAFYKKIYKMEPTYQFYSWYDHDEGRRQNCFDIMVHVLPVIMAIGLPILVVELMKK